MACIETLMQPDFLAIVDSRGISRGSVFARLKRLGNRPDSQTYAFNSTHRGYSLVITGVWSHFRRVVAERHAGNPDLQNVDKLIDFPILSGKSTFLSRNPALCACASISPLPQTLCVTQQTNTIISYDAQNVCICVLVD
jgi:hypothetical protein